MGVTVVKRKTLFECYESREISALFNFERNEVR